MNPRIVVDKQLVIEMTYLDNIWTRAYIGKVYDISGGMVTKILADPEFYINRPSVTKTLQQARSKIKFGKESGACCSVCEIFFKNEYGYPVVCDVCVDFMNTKPGKKYVPIASGITMRTIQTRFDGKPNYGLYRGG